MAIFKPEIINDEIKQGIKDETVFGVITDVAYDLVGKPGETITMVEYTAIGEVQDDRDDDEAIIFHEISTNEFQVPIKEMAIGAKVKEKDEIQGIGSVKDEAARQIKQRIANTFDKKAYETVLGVDESQVVDVSADVENNKVSYLNIAKATAKIRNDEGGEVYMFIHPNQVPDIVSDPLWQKVGTYNGEQLNTKLTAKEVGMINDVRIFKTDTIEYDEETGTYKDIIATSKTVKFRIQKEAKIREAYDIDYSLFKLAATTYYAVGLVNKENVAVLITK
jgi:N4-gp56 family major capsid protein